LLSKVFGEGEGGGGGWISGSADFLVMFMLPVMSSLFYFGSDLRTTLLLRYSVPYTLPHPLPHPPNQPTNQLTPLLTQLRRTLELQHTLSSTFTTLLITHLYPHSLITLTLHVLSTDGSLLATCLNAATLALIDAGVPMKDYLTAVTCGTTDAYSDTNDDGKGARGDPILDVNASEESDGVPFLTVGCLGKGAEGTLHSHSGDGDGDGQDAGAGKVVVLVCETRVPLSAIEGMVAVCVDGCERVRGMLDSVVRKAGKEFLRGERVR